MYKDYTFMFVPITIVALVIVPKRLEHNCNLNQTHNHLVHNQSLNHLVKLAKWLSCVVSTYLYGAFDCMFLSCNVRVSERINALYSAECPRTPCLKQAQNLKSK